MRERSRRKPVDEEETKLGRWVSPRIILNSRATVLWIYIYMYYLLRILFFCGYTSTIYRISFTLLYICILHCALASLALLYHVIELCTRHWTFARSERCFFLFPFCLLPSVTLSRPFALSLPFSPVIRLNLNASLENARARWDFSRNYLHDSASAPAIIRPRIIGASRATVRTTVDAMTVVESRY